MQLLIMCSFIFKLVYSSDIHLSDVQLLFQYYMPDFFVAEMQGVFMDYRFKKFWNSDIFIEKRLVKCRAKCSNEDERNVDFESKLNCHTSALFIDDENVTTKSALSVSKAEASLPCFLDLNVSKIPGANRGVFTNIEIPKGVAFGPYKGQYRLVSRMKPEHPEMDHSYTWLIFSNEDEHGQPIFLKVDGINENKSNWLRYVNSARYEEEQNLVSIIVQNDLYFLSYKNIQPGEELLIWYGIDYAKSLGLKIRPNAMNTWSLDYAAPLFDVICESCTENANQTKTDNYPANSETSDENNFENDANELINVEL